MNRSTYPGLLVSTKRTKRSTSLFPGMKSPRAAEPNTSSRSTPNRRQRSEIPSRRSANSAMGCDVIIDGEDPAFAKLGQASRFRCGNEPWQKVARNRAPLSAVCPLPRRVPQRSEAAFRLVRRWERGGLASQCVSNGERLIVPSSVVCRPSSAILPLPPCYLPHPSSRRRFTPKILTDSAAARMLHSRTPSVVLALSSDQPKSRRQALRSSGASRDAAFHTTDTSTAK